jgi:hypothetical protein
MRKQRNKSKKQKDVSDYETSSDIDAPYEDCSDDDVYNGPHSPQTSECPTIPPSHYRETSISDEEEK